MHGQLEGSSNKRFKRHSALSGTTRMSNGTFSIQTPAARHTEQPSDDSIPSIRQIVPSRDIQVVPTHNIGFGFTIQYILCGTPALKIKIGLLPSFTILNG